MPQLVYKASVALTKPVLDLFSKKEQRGITAWKSERKNLAKLREGRRRWIVFRNLHIVRKLFLPAVICVN
jgi:hypothetical protein